MKDIRFPCIEIIPDDLELLAVYRLYFKQDMENAKVKIHPSSSLSAKIEAAKLDGIFEICEPPVGPISIRDVEYWQYLTEMNLAECLEPEQYFAIKKIIVDIADTVYNSITWKLFSLMRTDYVEMLAEYQRSVMKKMMSASEENGYKSVHTS